MSSKLGVIIPYVQEWPQIAFTLRAVHNELIDIPHEIVAVDNWCPQAYDQVLEMGTKIDRGHDRIELKDRVFVPTWTPDPDGIKERHQSSIGAQAGRLPWLKYVTYQDRLSHWQAKRIGCLSTDADILLFLDAHVIPAPGCLSGMYNLYKKKWHNLHGTLHAPLTYHILEEHKLIYKLVYERGLLGYSFTGYRDEQEPYEVPVMSTCGMMIHRSIMDDFYGWPDTLGIYGGGENFLNGVLGVLGYKKWIMPGPALHHHGDKRGYHYEWLDHKKNQAIAMYVAGGEKALDNYLQNLKPLAANPKLMHSVRYDVIAFNDHQRNKLVPKLKYELEEWIGKWTS